MSNDRQTASAALLQRLTEDDESLLDGRDPKVDAMLIERLYQSSFATRYVPIPMLFGAFVIYQDYLRWWQIAFIGLLYAVSTLHLDHQRDAYNANGGYDTATDWGLRFTFGCAGTGLSWGLLGWFAYPPGDFALQALLCVAWAGLTTSSLNTRAMHLPSFYAFIIGISVPFFARGFLFGEPSTVGMAFFGTILLAAQCFCAQVNNRRERLSAALRLRNAALISEIDRARVAAEISYRELEHAHHTLAADVATMQRICGIGSWHWQGPDGDVVWSDQFYHLLGLAPQSCPASLAAWLDCVHADDRELVRGHYQRLRQGAARDAIKFRIAAGDPAWPVWLESVAETERAPDGSVAWIRGLLRHEPVD
ncbi:MAG: PAS domain-containing protein [Ferrovibrio sp.]|uniref:PAS domain-containing protein n=1 Tax=Ferrovibrio sp. TaxID=1917215 RepID=UPI0026049645|nr:PAS domain-containing protein [Ferrovibrio sp.]MCW0233594.1 PAS domain-containing protein [Ferrovibrio sp.]